MPKKTLTAVFKRECAELVVFYGYKNKDVVAMNVGLSLIQCW